jgi:hypothetical protein
VPVTLLGIQVGASLKRLIDFKAQKDFKTGPTISDLQGQVFEIAMNDALFEVLEDIFDNHQELCPPTITNRECYVRSTKPSKRCVAHPIQERWK